MTITAITLVILSAFVHAGWNVLGKRSGADVAFYLVAAAFSFLVMVPLVALWRSTLLHLPGGMWWYLVPTGFFQGVYFIGLAGAYRKGELAAAYPVIRAVPVLIVPFVTMLFGIGSSPSALAWAGIIAVISGLTLHARPAEWKGQTLPAGSRGNRWFGWALLAGTGTAGYSLVDDMALRLARQTVVNSDGVFTASAALTVHAPLLYAAFQALSTVVFLGLWSIGTRGVRTVARDVRKTPLISTAATGIAVILAYALVLIAYGYADNVGHVVAFRQVNLPIGAVLSITVLRERPSPIRVVGTIVVVTGLVAVALG